MRVDELIATFHGEHRRLYTYDLPRASVELVNLRVTAVGVLPKRTPPPSAARGTDAQDARAGQRPVYFRGAGFAATPVYTRGRLAPGMALDGPAIVDQDDATCLVAPGFRARVDHAHNLLLERSNHGAIR